MENKCNTCEILEQGDRLYRYGEDEVGIIFEKIGNIQFCPMCGKRLLSFREKMDAYKKEHIAKNDF